MADRKQGSNVPANRKSTDISTQGMDILAQHSGAGSQSIGMQDILLPRVTILQDLSPQVKRRSADYVEGAEPGKILNVATGQVMDELVFIPCAYIRHHIEWKPNRGGFVRDHGEDEAIMDRVTGQNDAKFDVLDNGNLIVPTPTFYGIDVATGQQIILPMPRTQAKAARKLNSLWTSLTLEHPEKGKFAAPIWARSYKMTPAEKSDDQNTWFVWSVAPDAMVLDLAQERPELIQACVQFQNLVQSGEVRASAADFGEDEQPQGDGGGSGGY